MGIISGLLYYFFAAIVAGIVLLIRHAINHSQAAKNGKETKKNPAAWLNVLLCAGSFFLAASIVIFAKTVDAVAPAIIGTSLAIYIASIFLFQKSKYLKPVACALVGTILCTSLFWTGCFEDMGLDFSIAAPLTCACSVLLFLIASACFKVSWLASISFALILCLISTVGVCSNNEYVGTIVFAATPVTLAFLALTAWKNRVKWIPMIFRKAIILASFAYPIASIVSLLYIAMLLSFGVGINVIPCFFGLNLTLLTLYIAYFYVKTRSVVLKHLLRCATHISFLVLAYSLIRKILPTCTYDGAYQLVWAGVWGLSFLAELCYSLFRIRRTKKYGEEVPYLAVSTLCFLFTCTLAESAAYSTPGIGSLIVFIAFAVLGALFSVVLKNIYWSIASGFSLLVLPLIIAGIIGNSDPVLFTILYGLIGAVLAGIYAAIHSIKPKQSYIMSLVFISITALFLILNATELGFSYVGWGLSAAYLLVVFLLSKRWGVLEAVIYLSAIAASLLINDLVETSVYAESINSMRSLRDTCAVSHMSTREYTLEALQSGIFFSITGGAMLLTSAMFELRHRKIGPRFVIAYIWLAFIQLFAVGEAVSDGIYLYGLLYLVEQVAALIYGVYRHHIWLIVCSLIGIVVGTIMLSSGNSYIWLAVIGIALIAVVAWRLSILNKTNKESESKK